MPKRPLAVLLVGAALSLTARADLASVSNPPLCRVTATYRPLWWASNLRQITVRLDPACPPDGLARVRLESGRIYPWRTVTPDRPARCRGIPWWWTGAWESASGRIYRFKIPGMHAPWEAR